MNTPQVPGWYPNPKGGPAKQYWNGTEWHSAVPSAHKRGGRRVAKVVVGIGLFVLVVSTAIGTALVWNGGDDRSLPQSSAAPAPPPSPRYLSDKMIPSDGMYRVGGDQIDPGVWESDGPSAPGVKPCSWARLSAPQNTPESTVEAGESPEGPARVWIAPADAAFFTAGCLPWRLVAQ